MGGSRGMLVCSNYKLCLPYFGQNLGHKVGYRLLRKPVAHIYFRFPAERGQSFSDSTE